MPENKQPEVEKSDLQQVLEAINGVAEMLQKEPEPEPVEEEPVVQPEVLSKDDVMAMIQAAIANLAPPAPEPVEVIEEEVVEETVVAEPMPTKVTYYYKAPVEDDFEDTEEYEKAVKEYDALVDKIKESIEPVEETVLSKSVEVTPGDVVEEPDFMKIWEVAEQSSLDQVLLKAKVE
jgi:hypothetical protein